MSGSLQENHGSGETDRRIERASNGRIRSAYTATPGLDAAKLAQELASSIEGEVRFDDGSRALYATDSSNYRQVPIGVVIPRSRIDVIRTVELCRAVNAPIVSRGGGTSLAGQSCNTAVVIDFSKYLNRVLEIDPVKRVARVEPGCILDDLRNAAVKHGLTFGPDPATHDHNTLGGMIGNNSGGVHALMNGITVHNVCALDILTYDGLLLHVGPTGEEELAELTRHTGRTGEIFQRLLALRDRYGAQIRARYPDIPRRVSGYENLDFLFAEKGCNVARALVGTEGTCITVLEATLQLIPNPAERIVAVVGFPDIYQAADAVPEVLKFGPVGLEGLDELLVDHIRTKHLHEDDLSVLPHGCGWLIAEFGGDTTQEAEGKANALVSSFAGRDEIDPKLVTDKVQQARIWKVRDSALGAESYVPNHPDTFPGWEDSAVHRDNLGKYLRELKGLFHAYGYNPCVYGHFGDGLVHCAVAFDVYDEPGIEHWRSFMNEAADLVVKYNGSLSGEHGDGQSRAELLTRMYGPDLVECFREFKSIWDPAGRMNPGKVVDPYPITSNLRFGPSYKPPALETHFAYEREGSFQRAAQRCVGVGKCRRHDSGDEVMCPSFQATHEERYSTRGRSRLLFEMLHGGPIKDLWKSEAVEEALDLCLACKGCKSDCPVHVDMATYKAEFRAHHYADKMRPRAAYTMGRIHQLARIGARAPRTFNVLANLPLLSGPAKRAAGIAPERSIPAFARQTFTQWFHARPARAATGRRVIVWPDTFNNYFRPQTAIAATHVLEALGFDVTIPRATLCCGRPLYDWGWLDRAQRLWRRTFSVLAEDIAAGTPLIGLEPACLSAFKDELPGLFPKDDAARRLAKQSVFFSDFVAEQNSDLIKNAGSRKALVQMHCHQHAVLKADGEKHLLQQTGADAHILPSGCCGMAGAFGFECDKYAVSQKIAERVLFPAVRDAAPDTDILANGFSCREQIEQGTGRDTLHIAEVLYRDMGLNGERT